jgi:hypothetical protein
VKLALLRLNLDVWRALGGGPLRGKRGKAFWRGGDGYSIALDTAKGTWYDHRDGRGGGVLALIETALGCSRAHALRWLEGEGFIEPRTLTLEQRREHAQRRATSGTVALDIAHWRYAFTAELNASKLAAAKADCDEALGRAASLCNVLENGSPQDIVREFIRHRANNPADVARLIAAGMKREQEARRITAEVVLLLARVAEWEDFRNAS